MQFKERPIPNFYNLAGQSTIVDCLVKDHDIVRLSEEIAIEVIETPGHSTDEVSYRLNDMIFIGDAVPVKGDIPIFIDVKKTKNTLRIFEELSEVKYFYPAWDQTYSHDMMQTKIAEGKEIVNQLETIVRRIDTGMDILELVDKVCESMKMPMLKSNHLFARTVEACRVGRR